MGWDAAAGCYPACRWNAVSSPEQFVAVHWKRLCALSFRDTGTRFTAESRIVRIATVAIGIKAMGASDMRMIEAAFIRKKL
jgi:hypothetical protein